MLWTSTIIIDEPLEYEKESHPYYKVVEQYRQGLDDAHILFPVIGLQCLERLHLLSRNGFMLLSADKGDHRMEHWEDREAPKIIHHGSFSLTANYHAIQQVYEQKGAETLFTDHYYNHLNVGCIQRLLSPLLMSIRGLHTNEV